MTEDADRSIEELGDALGALEDSGQSQLMTRLVALLEAVAREAAHNPRFGSALGAALSSTGAKHSAPTPRRPHRRQPGLFDPFDVFKADGEQGLREKLALLKVDELKDVVAEHGMDRDKLAMKWKTTDRLVERIVQTVTARVAKGDVFRN